MPAYVISETTGRDAEKLERYRELAARAVKHHGGRYLARNTRPLAAEGTWADEMRCVIIEFESMEALRAWYDSPEYAPARALATDALERRLLFVEGL